MHPDLITRAALEFYMTGATYADLIHDAELELGDLTPEEYEFAINLDIDQMLLNLVEEMVDR